ncbi:hypothetical protein NVS55_00995 [Myxococcus stipitatus]|uniref:hypothetical protein n=1 Tax=Myxococcus stipitatus TaxID=83455 RepID=UPI0031450647
MKVRSSWLGAACAAVVSVAGIAEAHDLTCTKLVNGQASVEATTFPFTANYSFEVTNVHPTLPSILLTALDPLLVTRGFVFTPPPPFPIAVGASVTSNFALTITSLEDCQALANLDGTPDNNIDNQFTAGFDLGSGLCTARVTCGPQTGCTNATRGLDFWRNHIPAVTQCLAGGPIPVASLGIVVALPDAEGLLWGNPDNYPITNLPRSELDRIRFLAARAMLVATCNQRVFGGATVPPNLLALILTALGTVDCDTLTTLTGQLDTYNASCETAPFPAGFDPGPSTPEAAQALAVDFTLPTLLPCLP